MTKFSDKLNINNFSIESIDLTEIDSAFDWLPKNGIVDLNIAEKGLVMTLHAQNACQDLIIKVEKLISIKESERNKSWADAALNKAIKAGHKTIKNKEWFAQADDEYIDACNQVAIAKAAKRWLENKSNYFSSWHYAFKTFLKRDYSLEKLGNFQALEYNSLDKPIGHRSGFDAENDDISGEIDWQE